MKKKLLGAVMCTALAASVLSGCLGSTPQKDNTDSHPDTNNPDANNPDTDRPVSNNPSVPDDAVQDETSVSETGTDDETGKTIAIAMPDQSSGRWMEDALTMKKDLESKGYTVDVQFAENDPKLQASQVESFVHAEADCMIIAAVDSGELTTSAHAAKEADIPIIAYDRLLMDTDAVSFYAAFDHKGIGVQIGQSVIEKAGLDDLEDGAYRTIEFFMGSPDDNHSVLLYDGLMEALRPYMDDGRLVCKSKRVSFEDTCISKNSEKTAQKRCAKYLEKYYTNEDLSICVAAFDSLSYGCKAAFTAAGYTEDNWPVISGQDCEIQACRNILEGTQSFSIHKDTRVLAVECAALADAVVTGTPPQINNTEQYDNNVFVVPAHVCMPEVADADNLKELLIDRGYYTEEELLES